MKSQPRSGINGYIYIFTNPSFPDYVKIGYADDVLSRLRQLNSSEGLPFAFRVYATYEVEERLTDLKLHAMIDQLNPNLRARDNVNGKTRAREFFAMSPEEAYSILEAIAEINGRKDRLHRCDPSDRERKDEHLVQESEAPGIERRSPFSFSMCKIPIGATIQFVHQGSPHSGAKCTVVDNKKVEYQGRIYSLSALATELTGIRGSVAGPRFFQYNGQWLNELRSKEETRPLTSRLDDVWVLPCDPTKYDIVAAFEHMDVIDWGQSTHVNVGDIVYVYVAKKYHSIMFKCDVIAAGLHGNRAANDKAYYKNLNYKEQAANSDTPYMKLHLIEKYPVGKYPLKELQENGLTNVRNSVRATVQLMNYLKSKK